jgi:hypothetical protein
MTAIAASTSAERAGRLARKSLLVAILALVVAAIALRFTGWHLNLEDLRTRK